MTTNTNYSNDRLAGIFEPRDSEILSKPRTCAHLDLHLFETITIFPAKWPQHQAGSGQPSIIDRITKWTEDKTPKKIEQGIEQYDDFMDKSLRDDIDKHMDAVWVHSVLHGLLADLEDRLIGVF